MEIQIRDKLTQQQWSPEQIAENAKKNHIPMVSHERIYQFIRKDKQEGGKLYTHLRHKLKKRRKRPVFPTGYPYMNGRLLLMNEAGLETGKWT